MKKSVIVSCFLLSVTLYAAGKTLSPNEEVAVTEGIVLAPSDELWRVFSTAEGFKALGVAQAKMDFRVGGLILSSYEAEAKLGDENTIQTEIGI